MTQIIQEIPPELVVVVGAVGWLVAVGVVGGGVGAEVATDACDWPFATM